MTARALILACLALGFVATGCGGGGSTGPDGDGDETMTASIGGQAFVSAQDPYIQATNGPARGSVVITGTQMLSSNSYRSVMLTLGRIEGPGTYPLGVDGSTVAGGSASVLIAGGGAPTTWTTPLSGNAGTVTITSVSATRLVGDFSFTATPLPGQQGTNQTVTNGHFDVELNPGFAVASGTARASRISGTIGGNAWNAAVVTPVGSLQNGVFVLAGSNTSYMFDLIPFPGLSVGIFPVTAGTQAHVYLIGVPNGWGPTGTGSMTITSFGAGRVAGTFNVTLNPVGQAQGTMAATGTFDINLALTN